MIKEFRGLVFIAQRKCPRRGAWLMKGAAPRARPPGSPISLCSSRRRGPRQARRKPSCLSCYCGNPFLATHTVGRRGYGVEIILRGLPIRSAWRSDVTIRPFVVPLDGSTVGSVFALECFDPCGIRCQVARGWKTRFKHLPSSLQRPTPRPA